MTTAIFDINETTLDLTPVRAVIDRLVPDEGGARAWFPRLLQLSMTVTATGRFVDFSTLARQALVAVAGTGGREDAIHDEAWAEVAAAMGSLPVHDDVSDGLDRLREAGWQIVALTNSAHATVTAQLTAAGVIDRFDHVLSVDAVQRFKPSPETYRHALGVAGVRPDQAWMVAAHDWDLAGAKAVGLSTAFVHRPGQSWAPTFPEPDAWVSDFGELAGHLI